MNRSKYSLFLDLHRAAAARTVCVKRGDTAREIGITFVEDGGPYEISEDCIALLCAVLPDGAKRGTTMRKGGGELKAAIPSAWTEKEGDVECEVRVYDPVGRLFLTSPSFVIRVARALFADAPAEVSYGLYRDPEDAEVPGAFAYADSVTPGASKTEFTVTVPEGEHLIVAVPDSLGISATFEKAGPGGAPAAVSFAGPLADRYGVMRDYYINDVSEAGVWTVTIPQIPEGE